MKSPVLDVYLFVVLQLHLVLRTVLRVRPFHHAAGMLQSVDLRYDRVLGARSDAVRTHSDQLISFDLSSVDIGP